MITVGLVGATDPRHRWFLAAAQRRRAGVRIVDISEPVEAARYPLTEQYGLPGHADHQAMMTASAPSMVAIAMESAAGPIVVDALAQDADVIVAPPVCDSIDDLDAIADLVACTGRRLTAAHTYRGHPASRTVKDLAETGRLGRLVMVSLNLADTGDNERLRRSTLEGLDLFLWLTGATHGTIAAVVPDGPVRDKEPPEVVDHCGELTMIMNGASDDGPDATFEVRKRSGASDTPEVFQVVGCDGVVEWDVRTGLMRSWISTPEPLTISCGRPPDRAEWVLTNLMRARRPAISSDHSLTTTRLLLNADISQQRRGEPQPWRMARS